MLSARPIERQEQRAVGVEAEQADAALRHQVFVLVPDPRLPDLGRASSAHRPGDGVQASGADGSDEGGVVLEAGHPLSPGVGDQGGPDRGQRLHHAGVNAAVHDPVALVMLLGDLPLAADLLGGGVEDPDAHLLDPAAGQVVYIAGQVPRRQVHPLTVNQAPPAPPATERKYEGPVE